MNALNTNFKFLDYLKCLAIILVIITHYRYTEIESSHIIFPLAVNMAVPIFMLVTGFLYAESFSKKQISRLKDMYNFESINKRFLRLTIPFMFIFAIEYIFNFAHIRTVDNIFINFIKGGIGPGSYYYPVMLQIILVFPLLYTFAQKLNESKKVLGIFIVFAVEFLLMILTVNFKMDTELYRLLAFRYLSLVYLGCLFSINKQYFVEKNEKYLLLSFIIGLLYIIINSYTQNPFVTYPYIKDYWNTTSGFFIALYIFPIFCFIYEFFKEKDYNNIISKFIVNIGKASWHIFLIQMLYFLKIDGSLYHHSLASHPVLHMLLNILSCTIIGLIFYECEKRIKQIILKR